MVVPLYTVMYESLSRSIFFSSVSLNSGHFSGYVLVSHCYFNLHFSTDEYCAEHFYVYIQHLNIFFIELFVFLLLSCKSSLHILDLSPLSEFIGNILSLSVACLFIFLIVTLQRRKIFKNSF